MACQYFKEAYVGYCSASDFPYIPSIRDMQLFCFKDFRACSFCCRSQDAGIPISTLIYSEVSAAGNLEQPDAGCRSEAESLAHSMESRA